MRVPLTTFHGREFLFVMATEQEYGPHLRALFEPLMVGVGPVEAAAGTASALAMLAAGDHLSDLVVSLGSAGSPSLDHAAVYQVGSVSYRDMDASPLGFDKGKVPFSDIPVAIDLPIAIPSVPSARLSTGAGIVTGSAYDAIDADMVDMETYAVVRAAQMFDVPVVGLRGISDGRGPVEELGDWTAYLHVIDERLAAAVGRLTDALARNAIPLSSPRPKESP